MVSSFSYPSFKQFDVTRRMKYVYIARHPADAGADPVDPPTMLLRHVHLLRARTARCCGWAASCAGRAPRRRRRAGRALPRLRNAYLRRARHRRWVSRNAPAASEVAAEPEAGRIDSPRRARRCTEIAEPIVAPRPALPANIDWGPLREAVAACTACDLCKTRTQTVFGVGNTERNGWSSAKRRAPKKTARASPSSAAPASCSTRCCSPSACRARPCSSPTS